MTHLNYSLRKLGKTFELQNEILKTEINQDEVYSDTWKDKRSELLDFVNNDKLCTAFSIARYSRAIEEMTGFGLKGCLSLAGLGWKYFYSLRTEEDEPLYAYSDKYMR